MGYIRFAIENPVKVAVGVILVLLFGLLSLLTIPIQLTPNVDQPIITVDTSWTGRSPQEVEREIIEEQEDKLKGVTDLKKMTAVAEQGSATITLEFYIGTDMSRALQEVSDKLREVPEYPDDVDQPVITAADSSSENAMAWLMLSSSDPDFDIQGFFDIADDRIKPYLERVSGVGEINIYGGREHEVHIRVDPRRLAQRGVTFNELVAALRGENANVSAGDMNQGRLDVRVRTIGQYDDLDQVRRTIIAYTDGGPVRVGDVSEVVLTLEKRRSFVHANGTGGLAVQVIRETGSNVMTTMDALHERIELLNSEVLPTLAPGVTLTQVYDETVYIDDAIDLVQETLLIGGALTVIVLLLFLRTVRPTLLVSLAIPISVIGTFVVMTAFGRNLNVISLAGLAFAIGMVVDDAIVVLENIDRHLGMGKSVRRAAFDGTHEVWGAVLAATLTKMAVFLPILTIQEEAGQLFRDIALAIAAAVGLSLIVSVTVIPSAAARILKPHDTAAPRSLKARAKTLFGLAPLLGGLTAAFASLIYWLTGHTPARTLMRLAIVVGLTGASFLGAWWLMPPTDYLPAGNRNLVFGIMFNPPGYSLEHSESIAARIEEQVEPYWEAAEQNDSLEAAYAQIEPLPPVRAAFPPFKPIENIPPIENFFLVSFRGTMFMGAASADKSNVAPVADLLTSTMFSIPGSMGFAQQQSLFGRGLGGTSAVDVEISASDLDQLQAVAATMMQRLQQMYGPQAVRPDPQNFNMATPELQVKIDRVRAADLGIDVEELGLGVQALVDGANVGDYRYRGEAIDLMLTRDPDIALSPDSLRATPMATLDRAGENRAIVPLGAVANIQRTQAPQQIKRIEQRRAITLTVTAPPGLPLQTLMDQIDGLHEELTDAGVISGDVEVQLAGTADKLTQVREALIGSWHGFNMESFSSLATSRMFLALLVIFLLMAALFESFLYPLVIMFSVPPAAIGGFLLLAIVNHFIPAQQLDVLTMLGFVLLIGIVVSNAILLVHQALNFMRGVGEAESDIIDAMPPREAIRESVRTRIRPIFMTTATSCLGMLPLVVMPGSGSELYRGLGSVVLGGLVVSTLFTLLVVPLLFSLIIDAKVAAYRLLRWGEPQLTPASV